MGPVPDTGAPPDEPSRARVALAMAVPLAVLLVMVVGTSASTEPFFGGDETRHVMTGVFFYDFFRAGDWASPRHYAEQYYLQYPSLGLLIWPPLFHAVEGAAMLAFGPSLVVAKALIAAFAMLATAYLVALVARTHDGWTACVAGLLFVLSPMILTYSRQVMLEVPALAFVLAATYHWLVYLETGRAIHLWLAAAASCAAVLTRFDAAAVLPTLGLMLALRGDWGVLARPGTWLAAAVSCVAVAPVVWLTVTTVGALHMSTIVPESGGAGAAALDAMTYYVRSLPEQLGWLLAGAAVAGLVLALRGGSTWRAAIPYLSTVVCTYVVFTVIAEKVPRHAIGWVPAMAAFAASAVAALRTPAGRSWLATAAALVLCAGTALASTRERTPYLRGYARAAQYVVTQTRASSFTMFDGYYDGNFIYQIRRHDQDRRLWVLRADKLMYASVVNVGQQYTEFTRSDEDMAALLASYDPELVVVEAIPAGGWTPAARRLRRLLADHPERYRLERRFPVETTRHNSNKELLIYRSLSRNPTPRSSIDLEMLTLGGERFHAPEVTGP
jgi:4-amino-4-deoxy-L-arabinose transferase-like glycosyltransferase